MSKRKIKLDLVTTESYNTLVKWKGGFHFPLQAGTGSLSLLKHVPVVYVEENCASNPKISVSFPGNKQTTCFIYFLVSVVIF